VAAFPRQPLRLVALSLLLASACVGCSSPGGPSVTETPSGRASASPSTAGTAAPDAAAQAAALVGTLSDAELVGQVLVPSMNLSDAPAPAAAIVSQYKLGGVILMGDVRSSTGGTAAQVRALTTKLSAAGGKPALLIGTDQEYGWVTRIKSGIVQLPSAMTFGAAGQPDLTEAAWRGAGAELAAVGINVDFAPDSDVLGSAGNVIIGSRSFGSDPAAVSAQVTAAVRGLQSAGVAASVKHFPGHGHTTTDSHTALPVLSQSRASLNANDLPPFQAAIDAGTWLVMSGHLDVRSIDPGVPASFSHKVLVDLLRTSMHFDGVVITDALNMSPAQRWEPGEAAVRALVAGNDMLLMPPDLAAAHKGLLDGLHSGALPRPRLIEAVTRILTLKFRLAGLGPADPTNVEAAAHRDAALAAAAAAVTVLRGPCSGPVVSGPVRVSAASGRTQPVQWLTDALRDQGVDVVTTGGSLIHLVGYGDGSGQLDNSAEVAVSMDTPFVLRYSTSPVRLATYSSTQVAMQALAAVIAGKAKAVGRSPVAVTGLPRSACAS
jgi:beta-N-acetylhexosaminidase